MAAQSEELVRVIARRASPRRADPPAAQRRGAWRQFFVGLSGLYILIALVGFIPSFLSGPPVPLLADAHGALMLAWLLLFVTQSRRAVTGQLQRHREAGQLAIGLVVAIWVSMLVATASALIRLKPELDNFLWDVLMMQLAMLVEFPAFVAWGLLQRRNAGYHKRLMAIATLVLGQAGLDRMHWLPLPGPVMLWLLLIPFFAFDIATTRRLHPVTLVATGLIVSAHVTVLLLWGSPSWHRFAYGLMHGT